MTATLTDTRTATEQATETPILAHVVNCPDDKESTEAWLTEAMIFGYEVEALCGHRWVPSRDPQKRTGVCQPCLDAMETILNEVYG